MADGPTRPEGPRGKGVETNQTVPLVAGKPKGIHKNGDSLNLEPAEHAIDPTVAQAIEGDSQKSTRRSAAIIAAKNSGIADPTEEDIQRIRKEMDARAKSADISSNPFEKKG